ncbi:hypothetical protein AYO42_06185 [Rhizomicrobium sp. SCGC AG-212-E05]|nr:hypothetical protein AYO42_06185 [Rhizomicrobium sp. SCGC AG-212-E05]
MCTRLGRLARNWGVVKAYDYRNGAHRALALQTQDVSSGLRRVNDAVWPPHERAYGGPPESMRQRFSGPALVLARLIVPVLLLSTLLGAAYLFTDALLLLPDAPRAVQNAMLARSDLVLPMAWYAIHLCNRRYGAPYAFAQLLAGVGIVALVALINPGDINSWINSSPMLSLRAMLAFGVAFLFASFIGIIFFDAARGPRWWAAPLAASFAASLVFSAVYYPAAFAGADHLPWTDSALVHFIVFFGESIALLVPYYLLRPAMRPLNGMNGY